MIKEKSIPVVKPADGTVNGSQVPSYTNTWDMIAVHPDGRIVDRGTWFDEVSFYRYNGKEILRREQHVNYPDEPEIIQLDEVDRDTLTHVHLSIKIAGQEPHTEIFYKDNRIYGKKLFKVDGLNEIEKISVPFSFEMPEPVFDWHLWGVLISSFPLKEGYQARFLAHESHTYIPGDFRWYSLKVTGQDEIDGGKWGKVLCWTVNVKAEVPWKIWISVRKDIAPVQQIRIDHFDRTELWWKPKK